MIKYELNPFQEYNVQFTWPQKKLFFLVDTTKAFSPPPLPLSLVDNFFPLFLVVK